MHGKTTVSAMASSQMEQVSSGSFCGLDEDTDEDDTGRFAEGAVDEDDDTGRFVDEGVSTATYSPSNFQTAERQQKPPLSLAGLHLAICRMDLYA